MGEDVQETTSPVGEQGPALSEGQARVLTLDELSLHDVDAVRKVLDGGSVVDWRRLALTRRSEVLDFLRAVGFLPDLGRDRSRIRAIQRAAVSYLEENLDFDIPPDLAGPERVSDVFLAASGEPGERQRLACAVLKVMHIVHHLDARELKFRLAISDRDLFQRVEEQLLALVVELRGRGVGVLDLSPSVKEKGAVVTKLLSKRSALAARIYDRLRFRVITRTPADVLLLLRHLTLHLFPFNYAVPDESRNDVVGLEELLAERAAAGAAPPRPDVGPLEDNEYSGRDYRMISFVADVPVRAQEFLGRWDARFDRLGPVVYVMAEFQLFDEATWRANEEGEASHEAYKRRQLGGVIRRL